MLPLWAVRPVQSLSACTRCALYFLYLFSFIHDANFITELYVICGLSDFTTFSTLSHETYGSLKKNFLNIKCVF